MTWRAVAATAHADDALVFWSIESVAVLGPDDVALIVTWMLHDLGEAPLRR
jgi:hypothetical protein